MFIAVEATIRVVRIATLLSGTHLVSVMSVVSTPPAAPYISNNHLRVWNGSPRLSISHRLPEMGAFQRKDYVHSRRSHHKGGQDRDLTIWNPPRKRHVSC